jgi:hypothetical protein
MSNVALTWHLLLVGAKYTALTALFMGAGTGIFAAGEAISRWARKPAGYRHSLSTPAEVSYHRSIPHTTVRVIEPGPYDWSTDEQ